MQQLDVLTQQLQAPRAPGETLPQLVPLLVRALSDPMVVRALAAAGLAVQSVPQLPPIDTTSIAVENVQGPAAPPQGPPSPRGVSPLTSSLACEGPDDDEARAPLLTVPVTVPWVDDGELLSES
jgi:hypothetical protein